MSRKEDTSRLSSGKIEYLKVAVRYRDFNVTKSLVGGYAWGTQLLLILHKSMGLFQVLSYSTHCTKYNLFNLWRETN